MREIANWKKKVREIQIILIFPHFDRIRVIWISRTFFVFCLLVKKWGKLQIDKNTWIKKVRKIQFVKKCGKLKIDWKTLNKKVWEIQITLILSKSAGILNWKKSKQNKKGREIQITLVLYKKKCGKFQIDRKTNKTKKCGKFKLL